MKITFDNTRKCIESAPNFLVEHYNNISKYICENSLEYTFEIMEIMLLILLYHEFKKFNGMYFIIKLKEIYGRFIVLKMRKIIIYILISFIHLNSAYSIDNNDDKKIIDENIKQSIFKYNFDSWYTQFKIEIDKIGNNQKIEYENEISRLKNINNNSFIKQKTILENNIKSSQSDIIIAESFYRLALINFEEDRKNIDNSINLIMKGLKHINENSEFYELYIKMNLFYADLYFLKEDYNNSLKYYRIIDKSIDRKKSIKIYPFEKIRSIIGQGDSYFQKQDFNYANKMYIISKNILEKNLTLLQDLKINLDYSVDVRIILSAYRDGDFISVLKSMKIFAYNKDLYKKYVSDILLKDIIRIGGIALFETKKLDVYKSISSDKVYGNFGKEIILQSFPLYSQSGDYEAINVIAENLKNDYYNSNKYHYFIQQWIEINSNNPDKNRLFNIYYFATVEIAKNSLWSEKFVLNEEDDEFRKKMVLNYSLIAGDYFYKQGFQKNSKSTFLQSAEIFNARIQENDINDNKGNLLQKYSESLFMAGEYSSALSAIELALKYNLESNSFKSALFERVKITRKISSDADSTNNNNYKLYEKSVDEFFLNFPEDMQARSDLFESAKRAEIMSDLVNAKLRYERLLTYIPKNDDSINQSEKNKILQSLATILLKIKDKIHVNVIAAESLESYSKQLDSTDVTKRMVNNANYKLAEKYSDRLNKEGKIKESSLFLSGWSQSNLTNPESSRLYIESLKIFAQLQDWKKVFLLAQNFIQLYPNDPRISQSLFWKGKSQENLLLFNDALESYEKSIKFEDKLLKNKEKLYALNKAIDISYSLNEMQHTAKLLELKIEFQKIIHYPVKEIIDTQLRAANLYFNLNKMEKAKNIYKSVYTRKEISQRKKEEVYITLLMSNLHNNEDTVNKIDYYLENYMTNKKNYSRNFITNSIDYVNNYDYKMYIINNDIFYKNQNENFLKKMDDIIKRVQKRANYLSKNHSDQLTLSKTYTVIGELNEMLSGNYSYCYHNIKSKKSYLIASEKHNIEAKKFYSAALISSRGNAYENTKVHIIADKYFKILQNPFLYSLFDEQIGGEKYLQRYFYENQLMIQ